MEFIEIGDFDGDDYPDVCVIWGSYISSNESYNLYGISIFSYQKKENLLAEIITNNIGRNDAYKFSDFITYGDYDKDGRVEMIIQKKIYSFNGNTGKKNSHNSFRNKPGFKKR